jgi:hypothetical protein
MARFAVRRSLLLSKRIEGSSMGEAATALAILGLGCGLMVRLKVLLVVVLLLLVMTAFYATIGGFDFLHTALVIAATQIIVQTAYFLGVVVRSIIPGIRSLRPLA